MSNKGYKYASLCAQLQFKALHNIWEFAEPQVIVPIRQEISQHNTSLTYAIKMKKHVSGKYHNFAF